MWSYSSNCDILKQHQLKRDSERDSEFIEQKAKNKIFDVPNANKDNVIKARLKPAQLFSGSPVPRKMHIRIP